MQRAHGRRHRGRAIRKERREFRERLAVIENINWPNIYEGFNALAKAFTDFWVPRIEKLSEAFTNLGMALMGPEKQSDYVLIEASQALQGLDNLPASDPRVQARLPIIVPRWRTPGKSSVISGRITWTRRSPPTPTKSERALPDQ